MKHRLLATFAALASLAAVPAFADYGYSKFGMTPEEVVAASNGNAKLVAARPGSEVFRMSLLATGSLETGETLQFFFTKTTNRLMLVKLIPRSANCRTLVPDFTKAWGAPLKDTTDQMAPTLTSRMARWRVSGDIISAAVFIQSGQPDSCHLLFQPPGTEI